MRLNQYTGPIENLSPDEYYQRISDILEMCKKVEVFEYNGSFFSGSIVLTAKAYLRENPKKSFYDWLIYNGLEVITVRL